MSSSENDNSGRKCCKLLLILMGAQTLGLITMAASSLSTEARWAIAAVGAGVWFWSLFVYARPAVKAPATEPKAELNAPSAAPVEQVSKPQAKEEIPQASADATPQLSARAARHAARLAQTGGSPAVTSSDSHPASAQQTQSGQLAAQSSSSFSSQSNSQTGSHQVQTMEQAEAALKNASTAGLSDDLSQVATEVKTYALKLNRTITNLEGSLRRMMPSINGANKGMQEIKNELSRTMVSVIQVTQSSEMHAKKAKDVFVAAEEAAVGSTVGAQSTDQTIRNMDRIREQMDLIAERMENLLNKSQLMVQVVGFSDELALQSKVLSVNAAIEAAKAGDRGEGFSAVAREVKSLANQSKEATRQVRQILKEIQKSIAEVRSSVSLGNDTVDLASDQCRSTADSIKGLDNSVSSSRDAAEAIMNSSKEQVQGIMQISHAMNDIQTVSEQNSGSLGNLQVEAQKLSTIAKELVTDMNSYQKILEQLMDKIGKQ